MNNKDKNNLISRRTFLKGIIAGSITLGASGFLGYSFIYEPHRIIIERHTLQIKNLPPFLKGKKIIQVSDIHSSSIVSKKYIKKAFEKVKREKPYILLFTGDYVTKKGEYIQRIKDLSYLLKEIPYKIAVIGNHDRWASEEMVTKGLKESGFVVLINESFTINTGEKPFSIVGLDDLWTGTIDMEKSLSQVKGAYITIAHHPDVFPLAANKNIPILLSGHTHGGQVRIPFLGAPILPSAFRYEKGFYKIKESLLYVNRGLGFIPPPVRFLCPPEITVFTLLDK